MDCLLVLPQRDGQPVIASGNHEGSLELSPPWGFESPQGYSPLSPCEGEPATPPWNTMEPSEFILTPLQDELEEMLYEMRRFDGDGFSRFVQQCYHMYGVQHQAEKSPSLSSSRESVRSFHSFLQRNKISKTRLRKHLREWGFRELYCHLSEYVLGCREEMV